MLFIKRQDIPQSWITQWSDIHRKNYTIFHNTNVETINKSFSHGSKAQMLSIVIILFIK